MKKLVFLPFLVALFFACQDDDDARPLPDCEGTPILITQLTDFPDSDDFAFESFSVEGTCLTVTVGASGCTADGWTMTLRTDGSVAESIPTQTSARLIFDDGVDGGATCQAFFNRSFTFDLSEYLTAGALPSNLTLRGPDSETRVILFE